jgi:adenosylcobyric acid synthase
MHMGRTSGPDCARPWFTLDDGAKEGAVSADGKVRGAYLHGVFAADGFRRAFLENLRSGGASRVAYEAQIEQTLDALAMHLETHIAVDRLLAIATAAPRARRR